MTRLSESGHYAERVPHLLSGCASTRPAVHHDRRVDGRRPGGGRILPEDINFQ